MTTYLIYPHNKPGVRPGKDRAQHSHWTNENSHHQSANQQHMSMATPSTINRVNPPLPKHTGYRGESVAPQIIFLIQDARSVIKAGDH